MREWNRTLLTGCLLVVGMFVCLGAFLGGWWLRVQRNPPAVVSTTDLSLNRIALLGEDGNIQLVNADGSEPFSLTEDASQSRSYRYPTWSPDGRSLAFVELSLEAEDTLTSSALHFVSMENEERRQITTTFPPFYLFWNPTSEALAFLSNSSTGSISLQMVEVQAGATEATAVMEGSPFYFSWSPNGERLFAHIGREQLTFMDRAGVLEPLDVTAGLFQAPHWTVDGQRLAFVSQGEGRDNILNVSDASGGEITEVTREEGLFTLNWSPDSQRIAYSYTRRTAGFAAFGPLWVRDVETGSAWELSKEPVVAFFWSPDGRSLAFLRPEQREPVERAPEAAPLRQEPQLWLRWHVWNGERTYPLVRFSPTQEFLLDYLRFFDQYAQSISLWSPDSQMLLYTGLSESGASGVWTLPIAENSTPRRVGRGVLATWSPR